MATQDGLPSRISTPTRYATSSILRTADLEKNVLHPTYCRHIPVVLYGLLGKQSTAGELLRQSREICKDGLARVMVLQTISSSRVLEFFDLVVLHGLLTAT